MEIEKKKKNWLSLFPSYLETWNFTSGWIRNRVELGPGTSQAVTSKQELRFSYFSNQANRYEKKNHYIC